jgi:hypothetical protein
MDPPMAERAKDRGDSTVRPISTARKRLTIGQTQKLLLAALRLREMKNGYRR